MVAKLGTIYTARAKLYSGYMKLIGDCIDTPNAIAKALMECPEAMTVKGLQVGSNAGTSLTKCRIGT